MRRRRKSYHTIEVPGKWWSRGEWVEKPMFDASSCRTVKTLAKLDRLLSSMPSPVIVYAHYYRSKCRGKKRGWILKYDGEK